MYIYAYGVGPAAQSEGLALVIGNPRIAAYDVPVLW
jgi:hypothetical protein